MSQRMGWEAWVVGAVLVLAGCEGGAPAPAEAQARPPAAGAGAPVDLARGKAIYGVHCAQCHGEKGDGAGAAAYLLAPRPRDFTTGTYRLISTADGLPTDEDLLATITRGMPGSSMPSWAHLSEADRRALVAHVKSFAAERLDGAREVIPVPPEPPADAASVERGRAGYLKNCAACHGAGGKGDGAQKMVDSLGNPTRPRDLTRGIFKGRSAPGDLFLRIRAGLPGSPMPAAELIPEGEIWDIVHYVRTLVPAGVEARVVQTRKTIPAARVDRAPRAPADAAWAGASETEIALTPLSWRDDRVETVAVAALHDKKDLAIRLTWATRTPSETTGRTQDFRDGCAVQLATGTEEPFLGMGQAGAPVELLHWKADWQRDAAGGGAGPALVAAQYPFTASDWTPSQLDLYAARDAGNLMAAADRKTGVELAEASGQGTLGTAPAAAQVASSQAAFANGAWRVVITRPLGRPDPCCADLQPGGRRPIAFAVWEGAFRDRNGQKSFSIWHDLELGK